MRNTIQAKTTLSVFLDGVENTAISDSKSTPLEVPILK